mmetsp:Transcript_10865/g.14150  ORF Transcript_10865/g.14150 Transcript_10865/m.14150 type:complete len:95 (+) Transcript_10865:389-673(+)
MRRFLQGKINEKWRSYSETIEKLWMGDPAMEETPGPVIAGPVLQTTKKGVRTVRTESCEVGGDGEWANVEHNQVVVIVYEITNIQQPADEKCCI